MTDVERKLPEPDLKGVTDPKLREALMRRIEAPEIPSAMDLGKESKPRRIITAKIEITVEDVKEGNDLEYLNGTIEGHKAEYVTCKYDDGPVHLGAQVAMIFGEMTKEVWDLNKKLDERPNAAPLSKPMEEK